MTDSTEHPAVCRCLFLNSRNSIWLDTQLQTVGKVPILSWVQPTDSHNGSLELLRHCIVFLLYGSWSVRRTISDSSHILLWTGQNVACNFRQSCFFYKEKDRRCHLYNHSVSLSYGLCEDRRTMLSKRTP